MEKDYIKETLEIVAEHLDIPVEQIVPTGEHRDSADVGTCEGYISPEILIKLPRKNIEE